MSFEVDRSSSAWAHIALCADLTWATEPDEFILANQRLWAQHCRVSQELQDTTLESQNLQTNQGELTDINKRTSKSQQNGSNSGRKNVKDIIPESRLAQFYGNFYYDEIREKCYSDGNERTHLRGYNGQGCENSDLTECWMLPEVEYWFRKLLDESDRSVFPRRRRQYMMVPDEDFERCSPVGARDAGEEAALAAKVHSIRALWASSVNRPSPPPRAPSPPVVSRKMRARRRQPRHLTLAPPPPAYCLEVPVQLFCDPSCKFQFNPPRPPQLTERQRAMGRLSASVQAVMRASIARCPPYRGTNVSRYAPTGQRPARCPDRKYGVWWPKDHPSPRLDHKFQLSHVHNNNQKALVKAETEDNKNEESPEVKNDSVASDQSPGAVQESQTPDKTESSEQQEEVVIDTQLPSTSAAAIDTGSRKKRLYSTVLSMNAPTSIGLTPVVRLAQKLVTPGLLKRNSKIALSGRVRPPNVDHKFDELEIEALEQYKESDDSIDTKFHELEQQAEEQYSKSNSNTSCSSGNSTEKKHTTEIDFKIKQPSKFPKQKPVDSVVIYSQNFPDLNSKATSAAILKNFQTPRRGEKKETHRPSKSSRIKHESQKAASDTDYEIREACLKNRKGPIRWTMHVIPPKKRHLTLCVSDFLSDEEMEETNSSIKDVGPYIKHHNTRKIKMSAHGGGDLHPIMRKT